MGAGGRKINLNREAEDGGKSGCRDDTALCWCKVQSPNQSHPKSKNIYSTLYCLFLLPGNSLKKKFFPPNLFKHKCLSSWTGNQTLPCDLMNVLSTLLWPALLNSHPHTNTHTAHLTKSQVINWNPAVHSRERVQSSSPTLVHYCRKVCTCSPTRYSGGLHSNLRDYNNGVCHAMEITVAESDPDTGFVAVNTTNIKAQTLWLVGRCP